MSESTNVLSLFSSVQLPDPLQELVLEAESMMTYEERQAPVPVARKLVQENQFPDQSMYVLDQQILGLKESLARLKFYLNDLDDLIPR
jgi:hypothetical protein